MAEKKAKKKAKRKTKKKATNKTPPQDNGKHPGGRPSKYNAGMPAKLLEFFDKMAGEQVQAENSKGQIQYVYRPEKLPTLAAFACEIGVHRETLLNWGERHPEFFDALKRAKEHQERILVENGLLGGYDKTFAIFTAKNLIDWRDKQDHEHTGKDGGAIVHEVRRTIVDAGHSDS